MRRCYLLFNLVRPEFYCVSAAEGVPGGERLNNVESRKTKLTKGICRSCYSIRRLNETHGSMIHPKESHSFLHLYLQFFCGLFIELLFYFLPENMNCTWWCRLGRDIVTKDVKNPTRLTELGRWKSRMITFCADWRDNSVTVSLT